MCIRDRAQATYVGPYNNQFLYEFKIDTDYYISDDGTLNVTSLSNYETSWTHLINLENEYHLTFMIKKDYFPDVAIDLSLIHIYRFQILNWCYKTSTFLKHCSR